VGGLFGNWLKLFIATCRSVICSHCRAFQHRFHLHYWVGLGLRSRHNGVHRKRGVACARYQHPIRNSSCGGTPRSCTPLANHREGPDETGAMLSQSMAIRNFSGEDRSFWCFTGHSFQGGYTVWAHWNEKMPTTWIVCDVGDSSECMGHHMPW